MDSKENVLRVYEKVLLLSDIDFAFLCDLLSTCSNVYVLNLISLANIKRIQLQNTNNSEY